MRERGIFFFFLHMMAIPVASMKKKTNRDPSKPNPSGLKRNKPHLPASGDQVSVATQNICGVSRMPLRDITRAAAFKNLLLAVALSPRAKFFTHESLHIIHAEEEFRRLHHVCGGRRSLRPACLCMGPASTPHWVSH